MRESERKIERECEREIGRVSGCLRNKKRREQDGLGRGKKELKRMEEEKIVVV